MSVSNDTLEKIFAINHSTGVLKELNLQELLDHVKYVNHDSKKVVQKLIPEIKLNAEAKDLKYSKKTTYIRESLIILTSYVNLAGKFNYEEFYLMDFSAEFEESLKIFHDSTIQIDFNRSLKEIYVPFPDIFQVLLKICESDIISEINIAKLFMLLRDYFCMANIQKLSDKGGLYKKSSRSKSNFGGELIRLKRSSDGKNFKDIQRFSGNLDFAKNLKDNDSFIEVQTSINENIESLNMFSLKTSTSSKYSKSYVLKEVLKFIAFKESPLIERMKASIPLVNLLLKDIDFEIIESELAFNTPGNNDYPFSYDTYLKNQFKDLLR